MKEIEKKFAEVLRQGRKERSWSQQDLANASGLSYALVQRAEGGGRISAPSREKLKAALASSLTNPLGATGTSSAAISSNPTEELRLFLDAAMGTMKAIGYERLKEMGIDLGKLLDTLRGDPDGPRHEAHHWVDEIFDHGGSGIQEAVVIYLRNAGGKFGKR